MVMWIMSDGNNVLDGGRIVINGGNPLKDCPTNWHVAKQWANDANDGAQDWERPVWSWDCGFKLDYDGPVLRFTSRFYPPKTHSGAKWDGPITILLMGDEIDERRFECETLEELRKQVSQFTSEYTEMVAKKLAT